MKSKNINKTTKYKQNMNNNLCARIIYIIMYILMVFLV